MQKIKDLFKSVFALKAIVTSIVILALSVGAVALALNLAVYEIQIEDNGTVTSYEVYSKTVKDVLEETGVKLLEGDVLSCELGDVAKEKSKISITRAKTVIIAFDEENETVRTISKTVGELIAERKIPLGDKNLLLTDANTTITDNLKVQIIAKNYREVKETEKIPFEIRSVPNSSMKKGTEKVKEAGKDGTLEKTYKVLEFNGQVIEKTIVSEKVTEEPEHKVVEYGTKVASVTSRGDTTRTNNSSKKTTNQKTSVPASSGTQKSAHGFSYSRVLEMTAYAYTGGGLTASGVPCQVGRVAVDPKVIPLGTRLYIEAYDGKSWTYGYAVASDTGGSIKGNKIDLYRNTESECINFGVRKAKVYVLN